MRGLIARRHSGEGRPNEIVNLSKRTLIFLFEVDIHPEPDCKSASP
jgi:hypothetical protein